MDTPKDARVDELLGEAIKLMVESGTPAVFVGKFALGFPEKIVKVLGAPQAVPELDLEAIIQRTVQVTLGTRVGVATESGRRGPRPAGKTRLNIQAEGKRTSISVRNDLLQRMVEQDGELAVKKLLQLFADEADNASGNRTSAVEARMAQFLVLREVEAEQSPRH